MGSVGVIRAALRRFFEVDRMSIALAAISGLAEERMAPKSLVSEFMARYDYNPSRCAPWVDNSNYGHE
jgi:pyruvate dehydrogenase E1 component